MGMAKRQQELNAARGWSGDDTLVCTRCVIDPALVAALKASGEAGLCFYCGRAGVLGPLDLVLELVVAGLHYEYEDPLNNLAIDEGEFVGEVEDTYDLLWDLGVTDSERVHRALVRAIELDQWCQRDPYAATPAQALTWGWEAFREYVKHRRRFTFLTTDLSTADGAGEIPMHEMPAKVTAAVKEAGLIETLSAGAKWWRVRSHDPGIRHTSAASLGTAPDHVAQDNRMSPKGIGAFYGCSTLAGARAEVAGYAVAGQEGSAGAFESTVPMSVVNLQELPGVPSLFDVDRRHLRAPIRFLHDFVADVTRIADPSDKRNLEYVPTQVIAETFRYELGVEGILWRSSKNRDVTSCVLFVASHQVADKAAIDHTTRLALDPVTVTHLRAPL